VPKITFIKNVEDEIIYPKTHEDAIITSDGISFSTKIQKITDILNNKAESNHTHDYDTLKNLPTTMPANGGNSDTVDGKSVDDTKTSTSYLWTSTKISTELDKISSKTDEISNELANTNNIVNTISLMNAVVISDTEPTSASIWIDSVKNILKYKVGTQWVTLDTNLTFI
jgi:hypothetical protein